MLAQIGIPIFILVIGYVLYIFSRPGKVIKKKLYLNKINIGPNIPGMNVPRGSKRKNNHRKSR